MGISPCEFESRPGHQRVKELDVSNSFFVLVSKRMEALLRSPPEFTTEPNGLCRKFRWGEVEKSCIFAVWESEKII